MTRRPLLNALANRAGILTAYTDAGGQQRQTSDATREALLAAMGLDASTEERAARSIEAFDRAADRLLPPVAVTPVEASRLRLALPPGVTGTMTWSVDLTGEDGIRRELQGETRPGRSDTLEIPLDPRPPFGYYEARATLRAAGRLLEGRQLLIVAPPACHPFSSRPTDRRFGIAANLYALRGRDDWGIGDFGQLHRLIEYAAVARAAFVGINPLHALRNRGQWISPYSPTSRLFRNPLYIDVTQVPGLENCAPALERLASADFIAERDRLHSSTHIAYESVLRLKHAVLEALHDDFLNRRADGRDERAADYARYLQRHGEYLLDFATYSALDDRFSPPGDASLDAVWPVAYRDPHSSGTNDFRRAYARQVDFHCWLQYELDRQLAAAARHARQAGLDIGLIGDLAIGSAPGGADGWAHPDLFANGATIGAPPDDYSATGQNWGLPPFNPLRLADHGFRFWRAILRNALEHAGALRIDHVMGLFRQFWIPRDRTGAEGAYVRFPADELLAILAVESVRAGAIIIGEDLGTVPEGLPQRLARWNILSSRVLYFEQDRKGAFRASRRYSRRALISANTHDAPPLSGFWAGHDLLLRRSLGVLDEPAFQDAVRARLHSRDALIDVLVTERILPPGARPGGPELTTAVYRFLAHAPSPLLAVSFDDLAGELDPINLPGVSWLRFPSWTRRSRLAVEDVAADPDAMRILSGVRERVARPE
jgi:4-alpha-glucanotransferase